MISQKQNNFHWPEEETPLPLDKEQTTPATSSYWQSDEGQKLSKELDQELNATSSWRGWSLWLRILGVVVALVGGFALAFPMNISVGVYLLMPLLVGIVSAGLLRTWWAMLIVPVTFSVAFFLSNILQMGAFDLQNWAASGFEGVDILVLLGVVPIAIGVAIGIPIGKKIEQLSKKIVWRHRATA